MIYQRGTASSYDLWETLGNPGWNWNAVLPYFHKSANFTPPGPTRKNTFPDGFDAGDFTPGAGPLRVSCVLFLPRLSTPWLTSPARSELRGQCTGMTPKYLPHKSICSSSSPTTWVDR